MAYAYNHYIQEEAEANELFRVWGQPELQSEAMSQVTVASTSKDHLSNLLQVRKTSELIPNQIPLLLIK